MVLLGSSRKQLPMSRSLHVAWLMLSKVWATLLPIFPTFSSQRHSHCHLHSIHPSCTDTSNRLLLSPVWIRQYVTKIFAFKLSLVAVIAVRITILVSINFATFLILDTGTLVHRCSSSTGASHGLRLPQPKRSRSMRQSEQVPERVHPGSLEGS